MIVKSKEQLKALPSKEDLEDLSEMVEKPEPVRTPEEIFALDLYQEHLEEIGFLLSQCKGLFDDIDVDWPEVKDFEKRLEAHVDAVCVGGPLALECVKLFLSDDDEDNVFAAAYALTSKEYGGNGENINNIIKSLIDSYDDDDDLFKTYVKALKYGHSPLIRNKVEELLDHEHHEIQTAAVEILAYRREGDPVKIAKLLKAPNPKLRAAAVDFLGLTGYHDVLPFLEQLISDSSDPYWEKLILASVTIGSKKALNLARTACRSESTVTQYLPLYIAIAGDQTDLSLIINTLSYKKTCKYGLEGLGILGDIKAVPILIEGLKTEDKDLKSTASTALELITGAGLREKQIIEGEVVGKDKFSNSIEYDEDEELEELFAPEPIEIGVPATSQEQWIEWWQANQNRFNSKDRWRRGRPFTLGSCVEDLADPGCKYHERQRAYLELVIRSQHFIPFEADWFVPKQQKAINNWEKWWTLNKNRPK